MKAKTVVILILVVILTIVLIQNSGLVEFQMLFWHIYAPLFFLVLGVFAVGLIIGYLVAKVDRKKKTKAAAVPAGPEAKTSSAPVTKPGPSASSGPPPAMS